MRSSPPFHPARSFSPQGRATAAMGKYLSLAPPEDVEAVRCVSCSSLLFVGLAWFLFRGVYACVSRLSVSARRGLYEMMGSACMNRSNPACMHTQGGGGQPAQAVAAAVESMEKQGVVCRSGVDGIRFYCRVLGGGDPASDRPTHCPFENENTIVIMFYACSPNLATFRV